MADPQIEKLLIVQDRDAKLQKIELQLARIPKERQALEAQIGEERATIERARQALQAQKAERDEVDAAVKAKESAIQRFRTQQLEVKKNDEYRALTHQIEQGGTEIAELEERELELMLAIDAATEAFEAERAAIETRIASQEKQISQLEAREGTVRASLEDARQALEASRDASDATYLEQYDRVKQLVKRAPYVVKIEAHKCGGCHLRVSNEVSHGAMDAGEPHFCDQCGRMVYA